MSIGPYRLPSPIQITMRKILLSRAHNIVTNCKEYGWSNGWVGGRRRMRCLSAADGGRG